MILFKTLVVLTCFIGLLLGSKLQYFEGGCGLYKGKISDLQLKFH